MMKNRMKWLIVVGLIVLIFPASMACETTAPVVKQTPAPTGSTSNPIQENGKTVHYKIQLTNKQADGYVIPLGKVNIVCVITDIGMVGCGAFDVMALDSFSYPAVRVKSSDGNPIATIDDLQRGIVKEVNTAAAKLGIKIGMTGREALDML
jgi:uncharacterized protein YunC (DUF1805 family)